MDPLHLRLKCFGAGTLSHVQMRPREILLPAELSIQAIPQLIPPQKPKRMDPTSGGSLGGIQY